MALPDETQLARLGATASPSRPTYRRRARGCRPGQWRARCGTEYSRPFVAHASMAPSCAVAQLDRRGPRGVDAQPGHLQSARRPGAGAWRWPPEKHRRASTRRARAATARTAPTTWRSRRRCWRAPCQGRPVQPAVVARGRDGAGRRSAPGRPSTSRPTSTQRARSSAGATRCGATGTCRGRAAARRRRCRRPGSSPSRSRARWPPTRRLPAAAAPSATPCRSTISRPGASPVTAC